MKPTPRTDALYARLPKGLTAVSEATWVCNQYLDHACTLERELAEAVEVLQAKIEKLQKALDALVHAYEDEIDDYLRIEAACEQAKKLLPEYKSIISII